MEGRQRLCHDSLATKVDQVSLYSMMVDPMTTCGCCECIAAVLPMCNGIMTVNRDFMGMTPCGMKFTTLAGSAGGGAYAGISGTQQVQYRPEKVATRRRRYQTSGLAAQDPQRRAPGSLQKRCEEMGIPDFMDMIADETIGTTEDEILPFLEEKKHPALTMESILQ